MNSSTNVAKLKPRKLSSRLLRRYFLLLGAAGGGSVGARIKSQIPLVYRWLTLQGDVGPTFISASQQKQPRRNRTLAGNVAARRPPRSRLKAAQPFVF
jgi:hypothetical protein